MRLAIATGLAALALALPSTAHAQGEFGFGVIGGESLTDVVFSEVKVTGSVTVDFHGDAAAGCAAVRLCGVSGTVTWNPGRGGEILSFSFREGGRKFTSGITLIGDESGERAPLRTYARVRRTGAGGTPAGLCTDAASDQFSGIQIEPREGTALKLRVLGVPSSLGMPPDVLRTRCAGPMTTDVSSLLPAHLVSRSRLIRGGRTLDYSADRAFTAHGLSGTVDSNVKMRILRGVRAPNDGGVPPRTRKARRRALDVTYRIESVSGQVSTDVNGLADPDLCGPLDACGLMGSVTVAPSASFGELEIGARASMRHSRRDLRRALGLQGGPRARGVMRFGYASWEEHGTLRSDLTRDGVPDCTDGAPLSSGGALDLSYSGKRLDASYAGDVFGGDLLRTRCPGPGIVDVARDGGLAAAKVPLTAFRKSRITLRLAGGIAYAGDGYSGRSHPDMTVVLRRTRVHEYVEVTLLDALSARVRKLARRLP
jgi:hypothetical protein